VVCFITADAPAWRPENVRRHAARLEISSRPPYVRPIAKDVTTMMNPLQFLQQTRAEVAKVVWPTRREVLLTTIMVFILSALAATFFSLVDLGIRTALTAIIGS
jgi:preprotein translocase subunit SecE